VIRGDKDEMAVLCTKDRTYDIKEAEISNSMLIIPQLMTGQDLGQEVLGQELNIRQASSLVYHFLGSG
jgi:sister chromatid cohesion protein DCC1